MDGWMQWFLSRLDCQPVAMVTGQGGIVLFGGETNGSFGEGVTMCDFEKETADRPFTPLLEETNQKTLAA